MRWRVWRFNDGSMREYSGKTPHPMDRGKDFDATGAMGATVVTADALPGGAAGLHLERGSRTGRPKRQYQRHVVWA